MLKAINYIALILSIIWFISDLSWEPAIVIVTLIGTLYSIYQNQNQDNEVKNQKVYTLIILVILCLTLFISKPSEEAHKGVIFKIEKGVGTSEDGDKVTASKMASLFIADALIKSTEKSGEAPPIVNENIRNTVGLMYAQSYRLDLLHYSDLYLFSLGRTDDQISIGIISHILVFDFSKFKLSIISATEGESYFREESEKMSKKIKEQLINGLIKTIDPNQEYEGETLPSGEQIEHYIIYTDGTVLDTKSNLMWMRCSVGQHWINKSCLGRAKNFTWQETKSVTEEFAGYNDWRIPSIDELKSLIYCSNGNPEYFSNGASAGDKFDVGCGKGHDIPTILQSVFPNIPKEDPWYWSSTPTNTGSAAWLVHFDHGYDSGYQLDYPQYLLLVRNPAKRNNVN